MDNLQNVKTILTTLLPKTREIFDCVAATECLSVSNGVD